jgi:single-strand DNA-binding protein
VTARIRDGEGWRDGDTSFFRVNVWRAQAEHLADSLTKGDRVMVTAVSASAAGSDGDKRGDGHQLDRRMRAIPS